MTIAELYNNFDSPLLQRENAGISVALFYDRETKECFIHYVDTLTGVSFTLNPPKFLATDAYQHPMIYADAALRGIENPRRLVPCTVDYLPVPEAVAA